METRGPENQGVDRRALLRMAALGGVAPLVPRDGGGDAPSPRLTPFVAPLPVPPPPVPRAPFAPSEFAAEHLEDLGPIAAQARYYEIVQEEALVSLHPELPPTPVWRYRDTQAPADSPYLPGPTFVVRQGVPQVVRHLNRLPRNHVGFGVNQTTVHYHGGHVLPFFDGFPESVADLPGPVTIGPGEQFDYVYAMQDFGFFHGRPDPTDRPSTQWYHDHFIDFTGPNVYRGLAAFYLVFDELDTGDETTGLRLPSGPFDIPMVLQDRRVRRDGTLVYEPGDFNGFLGDQMLVNGAIQPFLEVRQRKYRFRFLNGANARMFLLRITNGEGRRPIPFDVIATDGGLLSRTLRGQNRLFISMAERFEIVVDFSRFTPGTELYLTDFLDQDSGRGPGGDFERPDEVKESQGRQMLKFIVQGGMVNDRSQVPDVLRPFAAIPPDVLARAERKHFRFERQGGAWAINHEFVDLERPLARAGTNVPQIWTFENGGGGWWHPIHTHIEFGHVLRRNRRTPGPLELDGNAKKDDVLLAGGDEVEVFFDFRDFLGASVFHCHNLEHEDHFMMGRFDIEGEGLSVGKRR